MRGPLLVSIAGALWRTVGIANGLMTGQAALDPPVVVRRRSLIGVASLLAAASALGVPGMQRGRVPWGLRASLGVAGAVVAARRAMARVLHPLRATRLGLGGALLARPQATLGLGALPGRDRCFLVHIGDAARGVPISPWCRDCTAAGPRARGSPRLHQSDPCIRECFHDRTAFRRLPFERSRHLQGSFPSLCRDPDHGLHASRTGPARRMERGPS